jgi:hypothetical protein
MTEGETGLLSLLQAGLVPKETPHWPEDFQDWWKLRQVCEAVLHEPHDYESLVLDTSNGAERILGKMVLATHFNGELGGKNGFNAYGKGNEACVPYWSDFLRLLDEIRVQRNMAIILLAHTRIKSVNNPQGDDYDQMRPEGIDKLWSLTHKWSDVIAYGGFELSVKDDKVVGTAGRVIHTSASPAVVAGNRYSLPPKIPCGRDAQSAWAKFDAELTRAVSRTPAAPTAPPRVVTLEQFQALVKRKAVRWSEAIAAINKQFGTNHPPKARWSDLAPAHQVWVFDDISLLEDYNPEDDGPGKEPPAPPPPPPPPPTPATTNGNASTAAATSTSASATSTSSANPNTAPRTDGPEGKQGSDPTSSTTTVSASRTDRTISEMEAQVLLAQIHANNYDWPMMREWDPTNPLPDRITDLTFSRWQVLMTKLQRVKPGRKKQEQTA